MWAYVVQAFVQVLIQGLFLGVSPKVGPGGPGGNADLLTTRATQHKAIKEHAPKWRGQNLIYFTQK